MQGGGILIEYILIPAAAIPIVAWAVLWYFIKRNLAKRDAEREKKEAEAKALILKIEEERAKREAEKEAHIKEREAEKEAHIKERWAQFTKTQCDIKGNLDTIAKAMALKLDKSEHKGICDEHMDIIWERLDHHCHDSKGAVVFSPGARR
jgi:hypothetical protein